MNRDLRWAIALGLLGSAAATFAAEDAQANWMVVLTFLGVVFLVADALSRD